MNKKTHSREGSLQIPVPAGSDLDAALREAATQHQQIELVHNGQRYQLVPLLGDWHDTERALRTAEVASMRASRDAQPPLGMTTVDLVREARGEDDENEQ